MAVAINLTDVSMGSWAFDDIVERIRAEAKPEDASVMAQIYDQLSIGSISTRKQDARGFNAFAQAAMPAPKCLMKRRCKCVYR